jgi:hypothetical protein
MFSNDSKGSGPVSVTRVSFCGEAKYLNDISIFKDNMLHKYVFIWKNDNLFTIKIFKDENLIATYQHNSKVRN